MIQFIIASLLAIIPIIMFAGLLTWDIKRREKIFKLPLTTRLLRPPGESLRLQIDALYDKLSEKLMALLICCGSIWLGISIAFANLITGSIFILTGSLFFVFYAVSLWKLGDLMRNCRLGFLGERAVGEELNQLLASGWKVFHDVEFHENPGQKPFNVDHVVVGTGGVFSIETKTRRKRVKRKKEDPKNEVTFNGSTLIYPWGEERFGIDQARQRAAYLDKWLRTQLGQEVSVQPVLALPGWAVHRRAKSDLRVISGREIPNLFRDEDKKQRLEPQTVKAITALLDQKCRDVE